MSWRTRVPVTRSEATVERWMEAARTTRNSRRSGPAEDRAQAGGGQEQGGSGPTTSIWNAGGAFTNRMTAENTRRASGHCMCIQGDDSTYAHGPLRPSRGGIDSFLDQSDFKHVVEQFKRR
jgi:hypothetical protein